MPESRQILVVDDSLASLRLLADILERNGYVVRPASSGRLALRTAAMKAPDLILLDVKMPDMDGYEVCRRLKEDPELNEIPVIFITALDSAEDKVKGFNAGCVDYILKPYQSNEVLARVQTHLVLQDLKKRLKEQNSLLQQEIADRKRAQEDLVREKDQLKDLLHFYQYPEAQMDDISAYIIEECVRISESRLGFFGLVNEDETSMSVHLWSEMAMDECGMDNKPVEFSLKNAGVWAEAIRKHTPLIINDYSIPDPRKKGYPEGHVAVRRLMSVPLIRDGRAVALVGVANKGEDYCEADLLHLSLFLESAWDMYKRKQAEASLAESVSKLRESEEKYNRFFQTSMDCTFITSFDGYWIDLNDAAVELFGFSSREELMQVRIPDLYANSEDRVEHIRRVRECGYAREIPIDLLKKDGSLMHTLITTVPFHDRQGKTIGFQGTIRDVTGRRLMEEELRRLNAELEQKVEERTGQLIEAQEELIRKEKLSILGQLAGTVSHELRNPLGVMNNAVYLLNMVLTDADEMIREYLGIIKNEIDNSQRIINDLLDFARTKQPQPQEVDVGRLVNESLEKSVVPENIAVRTEIPDTLPTLMTDPHQMGQVLQNLITNAIQARPAGGSLTVKAEEEREARFVRISILDTGKGISPEGMKKLFQPLYTTKKMGIGLGLVVCKDLVEVNNGRIEVESEEGKGATFRVVLPVNPLD